MKAHAVIALAFAQIMPAHAAPDNAVVHYQVRRGDTLSTLAQNYCRHASDYLALQKISRIRDPRRMTVGQTLVIPKSMLRIEKTTGQILAFRGAVKILRSGQSTPVTTGDQVREGDIVVTNVNSFISLGLADATVVSLPSQSRVHLARLRRVLLTNTIERSFNVLAGQVNSVVHPLTKLGDSFRFSTPSSVSTVRGTQLRVSYDPLEQVARTEVIDGKVEVSSVDGSAVRMLPGGFGAINREGKVGDARALLVAPTLINANAIQEEADIHFAIAAIPEAASYRTEIAADAGFLDVVADARSAGIVRLPAVEDGNWFVRISAIDSNELQGFGAIYSFRRRLNVTDLISAERRADTIDGYLFRWRSMGSGRFQYRFQIFAKTDLDRPLVDEPGLTGQDFTVTSLSPGEYQWRVDTIQFLDGQVYEKWSANQQFTVSK